MATIDYPDFARDRGAGFWLRPRNLLAAHRKYSIFDNSVRWRDGYEGPDAEGRSRSTPFSSLHGRAAGSAFRFIVLADTGEGDRSQYGLLPLIRTLRPDYLIINGDVAYPAGNDDDYRAGLFQPYRGLGIPIWAVPGNHEYYSRNNGREFHEIFCTRKYDHEWRASGLLPPRQPGTYWELREPRSDRPLVVLGLDTLKCGNLDGAGWGKREDRRQHEWLRGRLDLAQRRSPKSKVVVLFHIPGLVNEKDAKEKLSKLHSGLAAFDCIRLVVCGHIHNYQGYSPTTFQKFLTSFLPRGVTPAARPRYIVCGGGGAFISSTIFQGPYQAADRYPTVDQWKQFATIGRRVVDRLGGVQSAGSRIAANLNESAAADADAAQLLSLLLFEVDGAGKTTVTPVFLDDVERLFSHLPANVKVDVQTTRHAPDPNQVQRCLQSQLAVTL